MSRHQGTGARMRRVRDAVMELRDPTVKEISLHVGLMPWEIRNHVNSLLAIGRIGPAHLRDGDRPATRRYEYILGIEA